MVTTRGYILHYLTRITNMTLNAAKLLKKSQFFKQFLFSICEKNERKKHFYLYNKWNLFLKRKHPD